jgi:mRNA interferase MazF
MLNYSSNDVLLVQYPFTDLSGAKVRPAVVVHALLTSPDIFIVPLTSRLSSLQPGEFVLADWKKAGLNVPTAVKHGIYTIHHNLVAKLVGHLSAKDSRSLKKTLREWLGL